MGKETAKEFLTRAEFNCNYITLTLLSKYTGSKELLQPCSEIVQARENEPEKFISFLLNGGGNL